MPNANHKRILCLLLCCLAGGLLLQSQNLVPNAGFEETNRQVYSMMDSGHEFGRAVKYWETPNLASTDLISPRFRTPKFEPIAAHNGKNMAGIVIHGDFWSEYVRVPLRDTLRRGQEYYIEFWVAYCRDYHKDDAKRYLNRYFGALTDTRFFIKNNEVIEGTPQVFSSESIELIPNQWVKISGTFVADKEASHLYIGQFYEPTVNNDLLLGYFYIDDVRLEQYSDVTTVFTPKESAPDGLNNIYFETDKHDLIGPSFETLNKVIEYLERNPSLQVQINGHTDNAGEDYHNQELSDNRAKAVYNYLIQNGISTERLSYKGYGSRQPIAPNSTEVGRQENRRVEFLASNALMSNTSLDQVNVAEADLNYRFSADIAPHDRLQLQKTGNYRTWSCDNNVPRTSDPASQKILNQYIAKDAKSFILEKSRSESLVMFNDAQEYPQTQAFFMQLLQDFYAQGFRYLGVEALDYIDTKLNNRRYPSINSGDRTDEPLYGELVRTALRVGFEVFPFRAKSEEVAKAQQILQRYPDLSPDAHNQHLSAEQWAAAMNINRHLQKNKEAKTLIYAHEQHIREQDFEGVRYMGAWLQSFSNINPLTIEQGYMNASCPEKEYPLYYTAQVRKPTVFAYNNKVLVQKETQRDGTEKIAYDIQVFHPRPRYEQRRPDWLNPFRNKKVVPVNLEKYQMQRPCLIFAYYADEDAEIAVPADVVEATDDATPTLFLPSGSYTLVLKDRQKRKRLEIDVP